MEKIKNVLLVGRENGWEDSPLAKALMLAGVHQARLTVIDVIEGLPSDLRMLVNAAVHIEDLQETAVNYRVEELERLISPIKNTGVRPGVKVLPGKLFVEITREVLQSKIDLLMVPTIAKRTLRRPLFGSLEMHLIRKCPCPVWLIKPTRRKKYRRIMAAVDVYENPESTSLSSRIMEIGASLARMEGSELHVVHAWELFGERTLAGRGGLSRSDVESLAGKVRAEHLDRVTGLVNKYAPEISSERIHFLKGDAASIILQVAKREKIELIVMGTVGRTGLTGFLIGNTAETVLQQVDSSVLAVKPEGFVSPVKL